MNQAGNSQTRHHLILRAELTTLGERVVTRTREMSAGEIMLPLELLPPIGSRVDLRLSFPGLVEPFTATGSVLIHHPSDGPGEAPAITIAIDPSDEAYRTRFAQLVAPEPADVSFPPYRILLVEDNSMVREMFAYGVQKYFKARGGVTVDLAPDGAEAWTMLEGSRYDLTIVDYFLPVVNGAQLIARMRGEGRYLGMPVVAISMGGEDARAASISAGADLFLDKPIVLRDLFSTLDRLLSQRQGAPA
jgi:CheY-like chemotaxis protein